MDSEWENHRKQVRNYNITGHAHFYTCSCQKRLPLLTNNQWRACLAKHLRNACDEHAFDLWAYVFMPEHIHLMIKPRKSNYDMGHFKKAFKDPFSKEIISFLKAHDSPLLNQLRVKGHRGEWSYRFGLKGGGYDTNLCDMEMIVQKVEYMHRNPVRRRLVKRADLWHWSSCLWLELGIRTDEPLRVDDWVETLLSG